MFGGGTYYGNPNQQAAAAAAAPLPVLRMAQTPPVQVSIPRAAVAAQQKGKGGSGGGGGGQLNTAAIGKRIAAMLNQKYGSSGQGSTIDPSTGMDFSQLPDDYNFNLPDEGSSDLSAADAATIPQGMDFSQLPDDFNFNL